MTRSLQVPYTIRHTIVEVRNPKVSNEQNSSSSPTGSTGSKRICFRCGEPFSRQHLKECRAQNVTCNGCGIKGHLKKCCKKLGNFPKDSNRQNNQSPSTGSNRMNFASTLPQTEADFFDEKGLPKQLHSSEPAYRQYVCTKEIPRESK